MNDLVFWPAYQLAQGIRDRTISATEVLNAHLTQIATHNSQLNAIATLDAERAQQRAREADEALAKGVLWGPLHGVPVTAKDLFATAGLRTTFSYKPLANYVPRQDVPVITRLRAAGAIVLGKTNMPSQGADFQTNSPLFGRANNPWNLSYTSGGSSGGGGAAVAAGLSPLDIGNDLGGSIRIPAHFCGVFGLKPTEHRVSSSLPGQPRTLRYLLASGPIARSIEDLRLCLSALEGPDGQEWEIPPSPRLVVPERSLRSYRIAWTCQFGTVPVTAETQATLEMLATKLEHLGCHVEHTQPHGFDFVGAWRTHGEIWGAQITASRPLPLRALMQLTSLLTPAHHLPGGPLFQGLLRGFSLGVRGYLQALTRRDAYTTQVERFLESWDLWLCPVVTRPAFPHCWTGKPLQIDQTLVSYLTAGCAYTAPFNLTGNPVVVIPVGRSRDGLPIGVQLVGRRWHDLELLAIAERITEVTGGFQPPPGYT
jgi:amidase